MRNEILVLSLIIFSGFGCFAQTVNLEQTRTMALANSRSLAKYNMSIDNSLRDEKSHLYSMFPSLSANYSASMSYLDRNWGFVNPVDTLNAGINFEVTQKIFEGGKSFIRKTLNSITTESVRKGALAEYFSVLASADDAYYAALEAAANLEAAESSLQTAVLSFSIAEIRYAGGIINLGDYLKTMAEKEARENTRNQARRNLNLCMTKLKTLTGISDAVELEAIDFGAYDDVMRRMAAISDEEADALYSDLLKIVMAANPSLARSALNSKRAEKNLSIARRDYSPTISVTVFSNNLLYTAADGLSNTPSGGVSIRGSIPIDFWVFANRVKKSKIARDSAALDYLDAVGVLEIETQNALLNVLSYAESVLSSRRSLEYTEKHFEFVMERYRLSVGSVSDVEEASSLLITSRNNLSRSSFGFLQSLSRLNSLGALDDEEKLLGLLRGN